MYCAFDDDKGVILAPFSINEEEKSDYGTSSKLQAVQSELCMPIVKSWNFWSCQTIVQKVCKAQIHTIYCLVYILFFPAAGPAGVRRWSLLLLLCLHIIMKP